ncbi:MAG TPA: SOS response-associated peptidase family protein [Dokdonella sp.]
MCYSAQVRADYRKYVRAWGADIDIRAFYQLYWLRSRGAKLKVPKSVDAMFAEPQGDDERAIRALIDAFNAGEATRLEQDLFRQRKRLADAERILATRTTKAALESRRIAGTKVDWLLGKLADLRRTEPHEQDARIFPGWHVPVLVREGGRRVLKPMRYQCRPAGKPATYDAKFPGTYNARRDNLEGFWDRQFGHTHAIMVANAFYENVSRHAMEHRELAPGEKAANVVLEFRPRPPHDMLVACLWSHWSGAGEPDLDSFAAITDEPPAEIAAAGHDRCIVPIKPEYVDAWLDPDPADRAALYAILDDRDRPYYEHRLAA